MKYSKVIQSHENIVSLFSDKPIQTITTKNTSHGEQDFREVLFVTFTDSSRLVIKLADNGFTDEAHLKMWKRTAEEYLKLGVYCPRIFPALDGTFPHVCYEGRTCIAYAEEFAPYRAASDWDEAEISKDGRYTYIEDVLMMNARMASQQHDYTDLPSGYCLFEVFDPSDPCDEVLENARNWYDTAKAVVPAPLMPQVERIWDRWLNNRAALEPLYQKLPRSVFQADLNPSNILLDDSGNFLGICDFNIAGRDVFLNYLMREVPYIIYAPDMSSDEDRVLHAIQYALRIVSRTYCFSDAEKQAALPLYRCLKPLWWTSIQELKETGQDPEALRKQLDHVEYMQTREIDFAADMGAQFE